LTASKSLSKEVVTPKYRQKPCDFHFARYRQILARIADIVELHQIDTVGAEPLQ